MERILPGSFVELLAGVLLLAALVVVIVSLFQGQNKPMMRLSAMVLFVASLCLFSDNGWVYLFGVVIIAIAITDLELIQNIVAIIRHPGYITGSGQSVHGSHHHKTNHKALPSLEVLEKEILHTLWTQQQNKWPDMSTLYTLRFDPTESDYHEVIDASKKLINEQLVGVTSSGDYYLTQAGYDYCKKYSTTFATQ